ncbi:hypothetical protein AB0H43_31730 [Hamadaea sp. NPDC050747]|uniref:hypothetical protein n=1 Tax=Hamadaea sp. NPDC050747 TaxID=3155789 RepID=UPI0033CFAA40
MNAPTPVKNAQPQRKFKSKHVAYGVIGVVVLGCCGFAIYRDNRRDCVDPSTMQRIDSSYCRSGGHGRWYYGGHGGGGTGKVTGGSFTRGGFGGHFGGGS